MVACSICSQGALLLLGKIRVQSSQEEWMLDHMTWDSHII